MHHVVSAKQWQTNKVLASGALITYVAQQLLFPVDELA